MRRKQYEARLIAVELAQVLFGSAPAATKESKAPAPRTPTAHTPAHGMTRIPAAQALRLIGVTPPQ
jgi:hypothetical protein